MDQSIIEVKDNVKDDNGIAICVESVLSRKEQLKQQYSGHGWARIKEEHINFEYRPKLASLHLPEDVKKEINELMEENDDETGAPPLKKPKLKGCNTRRGPDKSTKSVKLCPSVINGSTCIYGTSCRYEHNLATALATKLPDLPGPCYTYSVRGKCDMGPMCRFAGQHTDPAGKDMIQADLLSKYQESLNALDKKVQGRLRKKMYDFSPTYEALNKLGVRYQDKWNGKKRIGCVTDEAVIRLRSREKKQINFADKLYLAPLTTVGNLPFRRICKEMGADITCGEMAMSLNLLQGQQSEWALLRRHPSEDFFGVQICGAFPDALTKCAQLLNDTCQLDFVDINCGCPIDLVYTRGAGSGLLRHTAKLESIVRGMTAVLDCPLTLKMRTGIQEGRNVVHTLLPQLRDWGVSMVTVHGRSREQRYTRLADWDYIRDCANAGKPMPIFGNGDVISYDDYIRHKNDSGVDGIVLARGALIKPWIFTEIKEARDWDISANERLDLLRRYTNYGLEHWGSDQRGVESTRRFLLEWLSFLHRYIPVGLLEQPPQRINERPPYYIGRSDLETLMGSANCDDWVKISEMLLGPVPDGFTFLPKHKANSYR